MQSIAGEERNERLDFIDTSGRADGPSWIKPSPAIPVQCVRQSLNIEDVARPFDQERIFTNKEGLADLIAESALQGEQGVGISGKDVVPDLGPKWQSSRTLCFHLILDDPNRSEVFGRDHEGRMGRIDNLMMGSQLLFEEPQEICLCFSVEGKARLIIEDASGVLTPERAATLVPALKKEIGDMPLGLHMHSLVSLPQTTYLEAVKHGVDNLYCCVWPVADGNAPPSVQTTVRNLRYAGYDVEINDQAVDEISRHFEEQAFLHDKPMGEVQDFNLAHFDHQIPGGVLSNLTSQLREVGLEHKLPHVLEECGRVREDLGWPIQVTPFAQFLAVQGTFNAIHGERYSVVPDEVKKYALGYFGKHLSPVDPNVLDRIVERGSKAISLEIPDVEPGVDRLRARYPGMSDEERFLRYSFPEEISEAALSGPPIAPLPPILTSSFVDLLKALRNMKRGTQVFIQQGGVEITMESGAA